jgi:hypothetical protein
MIGWRSGHWNAGIAAGLVAVATLGAACGSKSSESAEALDQQALLRQLRNVKRGEVLIIGRKPVRFGGPYVFRPGGYVLRFMQTPTVSDGRPQLRVSLESRRGSRQSPYQLVLDTDRLRGRASVRISGRLIVHVVTNSGSYVLRFTPRARP